MCRLHRLPLQNEKGSVCGLVTQTDVLRYFVAHLHELLGDDLRASSALPSISALGLVSEKSSSSEPPSSSSSIFQTQTERQLEKISAEAPVIEAIDRLYKVSALALVDADGRLVGDLSADSLRQLSVHNFKRLYQSTGQMGDMVCRPKPGDQMSTLLTQPF